MFQIISKVHKRSGKNRIALFFDILKCSILYQAGYMDYFVFNFEDLTDKQRSTFITRGVNHAYIRYMNNREDYDKFDDKIKFNDLFKEYIKRDYLNLEACKVEDFEKFVKKHATIIVKPVAMQCGKGIEKYTISEKTDIQKLYEKLKENGQILVEEVVKQSTALQTLFPNAVNTLRIVTARKDGKTTVLFRAIRIGNGDNVVDNFNHGGMYSVINEKGMIEKPAIDKQGNVYETHPMTGTKIVGFQIPKFDEAIQMVKEASKKVEAVRLVGWDIAITENGPVMIEGNQLPGYDIYQSKVHLNDDKIGLKPYFDKVIYGEIKK